EVEGVGLNPTRTAFLEVMSRAGVGVHGQAEPGDGTLGEPVGRLVARGAPARGMRVAPHELPLVIDEVPALAAVACHAPGESRFERAGELRVKESDRLAGMAEGIRALGGRAAAEGDALVVGGGGLDGGRAEARSDHRLAMALAVAALGARGPCEVEGIEWAEVSFPGFLRTLSRLGARVEVA
ncbi:MAG: 3-phosphoshikimate 1-carboxyvinyltransferase, partial [Actinobacteria bacterium]|nr:3-phosphoshikimate 1-carboxyvinyltransferase [Actinomycetota bacterium]